MEQAARRHFLGWSEAPLAAAARWLGELPPEELGQCLVAVPGGRAGRRLLARLAEAAEPDWIPPRILTQGELVDSLVQLSAPTADRLTRTLAWAQALREAPPTEVATLFARPPQDLGGWLSLAERVRGLHGELAVEGLGFDWLRQELEERGQPAEARRWRVLGAAQLRFRELLAAQGLIDPHEGRLAAALEGQVQQGARVVLVGLADAGGLLAKVLAALDRPADILVFAPEAEAERFSPWGGVLTEAWLGREVPLDLAAWHVVATPAGQAEQALQSAAGRSQDGAVSFGMGSEEVTPHLVRRLAEAGVGGRVAAGTPLPRTRPHALLQAVAAFLGDRKQTHLAQLLRHPDCGARLQTAAPQSNPVLDLDAHFQKHLPWRADEDPVGKARFREPVEVLRANLDALLGELGSGGERSLPAWAPAIRGLLEAVYGNVGPGAAGATLLGALSAIGEALATWELLPPELAPKLTADGALELLMVDLSAATIPPPPDTGFEREADLLGWLELPLDDAPTLVLSGMQDGSVPETVRGDAFLPDGLRAHLGLVDDARRMARDLYALTLLSQSRELALVSGRRSQGGESLQPSRLLFHGPDAVVVDRLQHFLQHDRDPLRAELPETQATPLPADDQEPDYEVPGSMAVTAFSRYIESPRRFHLQSVLGLDTHDDRAREMDGRLYGTLVHEVLECLIRPTLRSNTDAEEIASALQDELARVALETFGPNPMPTVWLQLAQLEYRLEIFAREQAAWAAKGWRVEHVEWPKRSENTVPMKVDGEPMNIRGSIDRVDYHPTKGTWAILDYKTGDSGKSPDSAHRTRDGQWKDLQLPLYTHLAMSLEAGEAPRLGYVYLGRDESRIGMRWANKLDEDALAEAFAQAQQIVRAVRAGQVTDLGRWEPREPIFAGIVGLGLLDSDDQEADAGESA